MEQPYSNFVTHQGVVMYANKGMIGAHVRDDNKEVWKIVENPSSPGNNVFIPIGSVAAGAREYKPGSVADQEAAMRSVVVGLNMAPFVAAAEFSESAQIAADEKYISQLREGVSYPLDRVVVPSDGINRKADESFWINVGIPSDLLPQHTQAILREIVGPVIQRWAMKNVEYGDTANTLGSKGQFADINRKFGKLKRLMWDQSVPEWAISEGVEEVLQDLIGHAVLSIHYIRLEAMEEGARREA